jgi:FAD-dependent urate hydroxylase
MIKNRRMDHCRILIVGAGLAGLALARALGQAGFAPQVIEREPGWGVAGTGIYLPANGVRARRTLGLEGAVAARAAPDPSAAPPRPPRAPARRHRPPSAVGERRSLPGPAPDRAAPDPPRGRAGAVGPHHRVAGAPRRPVQVGLDDGSGGEFDLVVGADGLRSSVRRLAVDPRLPVPVGQHSWRFLTARPPRGHHLDGPARPRGFVSDRPGRPGVGLLLRRRDR